MAFSLSFPSPRAYRPAHSGRARSTANQQPLNGPPIRSRRIEVGRKRGAGPGITRPRAPHRTYSRTHVLTHCTYLTVRGSTPYAGFSSRRGKSTAPLVTFDPAGSRPHV